MPSNDKKKPVAQQIGAFQLLGSTLLYVLMTGALFFLFLVISGIFEAGRLLKAVSYTNSLLILGLTVTGSIWIIGFGLRTFTTSQQSISQMLPGLVCLTCAVVLGGNTAGSAVLAALIVASLWLEQRNAHTDKPEADSSDSSLKE